MITMKNIIDDKNPMIREISGYFTVGQPHILNYTL